MSKRYDQSTPAKKRRRYQKVGMFCWLQLLLVLGAHTYRISVCSCLKSAYLISHLDHLIGMLKLTPSIYRQQLLIVTIWGIDLDLLVKPLTKNWY